MSRKVDVKIKIKKQLIVRLGLNIHGAVTEGAYKNNQSSFENNVFKEAHIPAHGVITNSVNSAVIEPAISVKMNTITIHAADQANKFIPHCRL